MNMVRHWLQGSHTNLISFSVFFFFLLCTVNFSEVLDYFKTLEYLEEESVRSSGK